MTRSTDIDRALGFTIPRAMRAAASCGSGRCSTRSSPRTPIRPPIEQLLAEALALDRAARLDAQGRRRPADAAGADRGRRRRPAGVRLSRRRAARLCPVTMPTGWPRRRPTRRCSRCSARAISRSPSIRRRPGERYQGIVPLDGDSLAEAARELFRPVRADPEPDPARRPARRRRPAASPAGCCSSICPRARKGASGCTRGSTIPNGSMSRRSAATMGADELADPALPLETLVWRLFNEEDEVRVLPAAPLSRGCRCDADVYRGGARAVSRRRARGDGRRATA